MRSRPLATLLIFVFTAAPLFSVAQGKGPVTGQPVTGPINQSDSLGRRTGFWRIQTPERMGEPATTAYGNYIRGQRSGVWYTLGVNGDLISVEPYTQDQLDGEVKYFEEGNLAVVGNYLGLHADQPFDTIMVTDPVTRQEVQRIVPTSRGSLRHGMWRYYNTVTGRVFKEEEWQADELLGAQLIISPVDSAYIKRRDAVLPHNQKHPGRNLRPGHQFDPYRQ